MGIGGAVLIAAGLAAQPEDPLGIVMIINGFDLILHAVTLMAKILWGIQSTAYKILVGVEAIVDALVLVIDATAISMLVGPVGAGFVASLLANSPALALIGTSIGVDFLGFMSDLNDYVEHSLK
jgi:hypothetical protein